MVYAHKRIHIHFLIFFFQVASYLDRQFGGGKKGCMSTSGVWCCPIMCEQFCKVATVGTMMGFAESDVVFDWGDTSMCIYI